MLQIAPMDVKMLDIPTKNPLHVKHFPHMAYWVVVGSSWNKWVRSAGWVATFLAWLMFAYISKTDT